VKERIFIVGSETGSVTLLVKEDPDPKLGLKWDPNPDPDPKKWFRIHNTVPLHDLPLCLTFDVR
jgi:hypothetical protein